jgi:hypothetical protein
MIAAMRSLVLIGLAGAAAAAAAACSGGDTGLALTISAPDGPATASRIELVLAAPELLEVEGQLVGGKVRYFRQKATAGELKDLPRLDGFVVRIEARAGQGGESFVPFVIAYDASSQPVAVGLVRDMDGEPLELAVPGSSRIEATVELTTLAQADPKLGVMSGQIAEVHCASNNGPWRSGIAWQRPAKQQLRLLFPEPGGEAALDASNRRLDLDCDGSTAGEGDCDDVRPRFYRGADEACDGFDTNCDGSHFAITPCVPEVTACGGSTDGVQLCRDTDGGSALSLCVGSPQCRCQSGNPGPCSKCIFAFEGTASPLKVCSPGLARIPAGTSILTCDQLSPCSVEVVETDPAWDVAIAPSLQAEFRRSAIITSELWLQITSRSESLAAAPAASIGAAHLVVSTSSTVPRDIGIDLELSSSPVSSCSNLQTPGGSFAMQCSL